ncbi:MAG TPA: DCC1-like thiol-disulfide oxidoreductase family protein [Steroidobacteraceae bacterium]|jgi:predicted DCC family thiol-disulfide oxidoreductase YuxK
MALALRTLVYDGECGICRYWVTYWRDLTNDRVIYRAYQEAAKDFPAIPPSAFQRAIQLIEPDGHVYSDAAATFRVLRQMPGRTAWWLCYSNLPAYER